jgi:dimethylaniline monooxygenase (N-oxide forming)
MESAPSFSQIMARGWKITLVWVLGANFNTKFRLVGPWVWDGAKEVLEGDCWETVTRRGGFFGK